MSDYELEYMSRLSELVSLFRTSYGSSQHQVVLAIKIIEYVIKNQNTHKIPLFEIRAATECLDSFRKKHLIIGQELWIYWSRRDRMLHDSNIDDSVKTSILKRLHRIRMAWTKESRRFSAG